MTMRVNHGQAEHVFGEALKDAMQADFTPRSPHANGIRDVILGGHLTYRYVLVTALLAKATDPKINPRALQTGSDLPGAYDARSLCHKVVVPLERRLLNKALGGSNEPFLNKPARFKEVALTNAVRGGEDTRTLNALYTILTGIPTQEAAEKALRDAFHYALQRKPVSAEDLNLDTITKSGNADLQEFLDEVVAKTMEGETAALVAGTMLALFADEFWDDRTEVTVHPANQSGASSREVSDIDVRTAGLLVRTAEVKDKPFTAEDVEHAVSKVAAARHTRLLFIQGSRGHLMSGTEPDLVRRAEQQGVDLVFIGITEFSRSVFALCSGVTPLRVVETLLKFADTARVKDETLAHLKECARARGWM